MIHPDKIRDVIGPGGKMIRSITEETGAKIDISDDGTVNIATADGEAAQNSGRTHPRADRRSRNRRNLSRNGYAHR